jgi:hypothetical protein
MFVIDEARKDFIESGVSIIVGTRDGDLVPEIARGWAPRVLDGGSEVEFFIDEPASARTLENLRSNGLIAMTMTDPISFIALQLKGWRTDIGEPHPDDQPWIDRHREMFTEGLRARAIPALISRNYWSSKVIRVRFHVDEAYDQTPGPGAGGKL